MARMQEAHRRRTPEGIGTREGFRCVRTHRVAATTQIGRAEPFREVLVSLDSPYCAIYVLGLSENPFGWSDKLFDNRLMQGF